MSSNFNLFAWYRSQLLDKIENSERPVTVFFYQPEFASDKRKELSLDCGEYYRWYDTVTNKYPKDEIIAKYILDRINYQLESFTDNDDEEDEKKEENQYYYTYVFPIAYVKQFIIVIKDLILRNNVRVACHSSIYSKVKRDFPDVKIFDYRFYLPPLSGNEPYHSEEFVEEVEKQFNEKLITKIYNTELWPVTQKFLSSGNFNYTQEDLKELNDYDQIQDYIVKGKTNYKYAKKLEDILTKFRPNSLINEKFLDTLNPLNGEGRAFVATHKKVDLLVKDRLPIDKVGDYSEYYHEAFIGLAGTNQLRKEIPNFAYIYGILNCSLDKKEDGTIFCNSEKNPAILYERITGATDFGKFMFKDQRIVKEILFIIVLALAHAGNKCGFIHGDLNLNNVLIKTLDNPITVKYTLPKTGDVYITSKYVPIIIDYEFSQIEYDNKIICDKIPSYFCLYSQVPMLDVYNLINGVNSQNRYSGKYDKLYYPFPGFNDDYEFSNIFPHKWLCYEKFFSMTVEDYFYFLVSVEPQIWAKLNDERIRTTVFGEDV